MSKADQAQKKLRQYLEIEKAFGFDEAPKKNPRNAFAVLQPSTPSARSEALARLEAEYQNCKLCPLSATRTQVVFGSGSAQAELLFVGEAPGLDEDKQGKPFVGAAGQLLTKIIEAINLKREDVYIANCLKCRPPENRNPSPLEIETCSPILTKQIEIIRPTIICALGKFAAQTLLATEEPISKLRGRFHEFNGIALMPTFHPAHLLLNPDDKKLVWQDMKQIAQKLGLPPKG